MRRAIIFLLLAATAASPLAAQAWAGPGQGPDRADGRDGPRPDNRPGDRGGDGRRDDRIAQRPDNQRPGNPGPGGPRPDGSRPDDRRFDGQPGGRHDDARPDPRGDWRDGDRAGVVARQGWRNDDPRRPGWNDGRGPDGRGPGSIDYRNGRPEDRPGARWNGRDDGRGRVWSDNGRGGWNAGWRDDRRYDWQGYRAGNRAIYRAPRYYGPRGTDYSRWSRGYRVQPYFYGRNYWIADPWRYRLPPAYGSYRWVRYYDDVALVDVRSGLIEDIIYSFFYR